MPERFFTESITENEWSLAGFGRFDAEFSAEGERDFFWPLETLLTIISAADRVWPPSFSMEQGREAKAGRFFGWGKLDGVGVAFKLKIIRSNGYTKTIKLMIKEKIGWNQILE